MNTKISNIKMISVQKKIFSKKINWINKHLKFNPDLTQENFNKILLIKVFNIIMNLLNLTINYKSIPKIWLINYLIREKVTFF